MTSKLELAEAALRARGPAKIPDGLAERAARMALEATPEPLFFSRLFVVAWRAAAVSVAAAILLAVLAQPPKPAADPTSDDPVLGLTTMPDDVADPTYGLLGGGE